MRYAVKTSFIFTGTFLIEAESKEQAKEYAGKHCGLVMGGGIHSSLPDNGVDWDFPVHPDKIIASVKETA